MALAALVARLPALTDLPGATRALVEALIHTADDPDHYAGCVLHARTAAGYRGLFGVGIDGAERDPLPSATAWHAVSTTERPVLLSVVDGRARALGSVEVLEELGRLSIALSRADAARRYVPGPR